MSIETKVSKIITPYGGKLVDLLVTGKERDALIEEANQLPSIKISQRALHDLELLAVGGFSPLDRFMGQADYQNVLDNMRLADGTLFPIPVTLTVDEENLPEGAEKIVLRDSRNNLMAVMDIEEAYRWDKKEEAEKVLGSTDPRHPLVSEMDRWGEIHLR